MKLRVLFLAAGLVVLYLVVWRWPDPQARRAPDRLHQTSFARHLLARGEWRTHEAPTGHIHFRAGSYAARTAHRISETVDSARREVLAYLQFRDAQPIEVFFVDSREQMRQLVGRPLGGIVQAGERTALLLYNESYAPFVAHELAHLYTHYHWGAPRAGRWISEGIAASVSGDCQGHSVAALVKGLEEKRQLRTWSDLMRNFDSLDEVPANLQAASIVEFLRSRNGITEVRKAWMTTAWQPEPEMERLWRASLQATAAAAQLDVYRLREHGCVS